MPDDQEFLNATSKFRRCSYYGKLLESMGTIVHLRQDFFDSILDKICVLPVHADSVMISSRTVRSKLDILHKMQLYVM